MFAFVWMLSIRLRWFFRRFMPTNVLLAAIFTRRGLKWGMLMPLLATMYLFGAVLCAGLAEEGAPAWINLLVLLFFWNAAKFAISGPVSLVRLMRVRARKARAPRIVRVPVMTDGVVLDRLARPSARVLH